MEQQKNNLAEVAKVFLKLGVIGFGGPAVHIAMMEEEVVRKRAWMTDEHFLDLIGATNLIPGPNSTELTMHIGHERAGWKGLVTAGFCFILPAVIITAVVALAYQRYGQLPYLQPFIFGIKPAVIAVVVATMIALGRKALKSAALGILGLASGLAVLAGANEITVLFAAGFIGVFLCLIQPGRNNAYGIFPFTLLQINQAALDTSSLKLFLIFLKIGSILYGSGYVLFAFLNAELVAKGLLSKQQLIDAVAVGQVTPGPVFSSATFIGWQVGGLGGAVAATVGIFLPSFFFVALLNPIVPKLRKSKVMGAFLDSVNIASIAIILSVIIEVSREVLLDPRTILIAITSFIITFYFKKINIAFIITGGAILGYVLSFT
jgi:chromate transporter